MSINKPIGLMRVAHRCLTGLSPPTEMLPNPPAQDPLILQWRDSPEQKTIREVSFEQLNGFQS